MPSVPGKGLATFHAPALPSGIKKRSRIGWAVFSFSPFAVFIIGIRPLYCAAAAQGIRAYLPACAAVSLTRDGLAAILTRIALLYVP